MILTTLGVALLNYLTVLVRVGRGIDPMRPWDVIMILHTGIDTGIRMQLWTP